MLKTFGRAVIVASLAVVAVAAPATPGAAAPHKAAVSVVVAVSQSVLPSDGVTQATVNVTVSGTASPPTVTLTSGGQPAGACGVLGTASGTAPLSTTYTASSTPGACTITATAAGSTAVASVVEIANVVTVAASPAAIPGDGQDPSVVTATVRNGLTGAPVPGDAVAFSASGTCGSLKDTVTGGTQAVSYPTNASGQATITYLAVNGTGACSVTGMEAATGQTGSTNVNQNVVVSMTMSADPSLLKADGSSTATVEALVQNKANNGAVSGDQVTFSMSGTCGSLNPVTATTDPTGHATVTYTAAHATGTCIVSGTDALDNATDMTPIFQKPVLSVTVTVHNYGLQNQQGLILTSGRPGCADCSATLTATVMDATDNVPVPGDTVTWQDQGAPTAACAALPGGASPATTDGNGQVQFTYTSATTPGYCSFTASEGYQGAQAGLVVNEVAYPTFVFGNGPLTIPTTQTNGTPGTTYIDSFAYDPIVAAQSNVSGNAFEQVTFSVSGAACGTLSAGGTSGQTTITTAANNSGYAQVQYTAGSSNGTCLVWARESWTHQVAAQAVTQVTNNTSQDVFYQLHDYTSGPADGHGTAVGVGVHVLTSASAPDTKTTVTFSVIGSNCGTLSATKVATDSSGNAVTNYTVSTTPTWDGTTTGTVAACAIQATESRTGQSGIGDNIVQDPINLTLWGPTDPIAVNGTAILTAVTQDGVTGPSPTGVTDPVTFPTLNGSPSTACGSVGGAYTSGEATYIAYSGSSTVGTCTVTAKEADQGQTAMTTVTQGVYTIKLDASPDTVYAGGGPTGTSTVTATVTDGSGNPVVGDSVTLATEYGSPPGACGALSGTTGTTDSNGEVTVDYTSAAGGWCGLTATEATTGQNDEASVNAQAQQTGPSSVRITASTTSIPADGASPVTVTVTALNPDGSPATSAPENVTLAGTCGSVAPAPGTAMSGGFPITNANGQIEFTYTPSTAVGPCSLGADPGAVSTSVTQVQPVTVAVTASPLTLTTKGKATSTITVTLSAGPGGSGPLTQTQTVTLSLSGSPASACGKLSATTMTFSAFASAAATYTGTSASGACAVGARSSPGGTGGAAVITQGAGA